MPSAKETFMTVPVSSMMQEMHVMKIFYCQLSGYSSLAQPFFIKHIVVLAVHCVLCRRCIYLKHSLKTL